MPSNRISRAAAAQLLVSLIEQNHTDKEAKKSIAIAELGCGWGGAVHALQATLTENNISNVQTHGLENNILTWLWCMLVLSLKKKADSTPKINFHLKNFLNEPLAEYDYLVCYLCQSSMKSLAKKLTGTKKIKPNQKALYLISIAFSLPGYTPQQTLTCDDFFKTKIYGYRLYL